MWLEFGTESKKPPEQLPIVLQVLLSQQHRQRALDLLAQFLDLGVFFLVYFTLYLFSLTFVRILGSKPSVISWNLSVCIEAIIKPWA